MFHPNPSLFCPPMILSIGMKTSLPVTGPFMKEASQNKKCDENYMTGTAIIPTPSRKYKNYNNNDNDSNNNNDNDSNNNNDNDNDDDINNNKNNYYNHQNNKSIIFII